MIDFETAIALVRQRAPRLVAIDGLPVSGKSTLAERLETELGAKTVYIDDFLRPSHEWRGKVEPAFPFPYFRYDAFVQAVGDLAAGRVAHYRRYDWATDQLDDVVREVTPDGLVVIEGVSTLHRALTRHYDLRFWVDSDAATTLTASLERGVGDWEHEWRTLFSSSVALYLATGPARRADYRLAGRGAVP